MTMWLVRRGMETFPRDLEADGDDDLDEVFFELRYSEARNVDGVIKTFGLDDSRFGMNTRRPLDTPMHHNLPNGARHVEHTVTREQYQRAAERARSERA